MRGSVRKTVGGPWEVRCCGARRRVGLGGEGHGNRVAGAEPEGRSFAGGGTGRYLVGARGAGDPDACHAGC